MHLDNPWKNRFRYVILIVALLCLTSISSNTLAFNLAHVCMATASHINDTSENRQKFALIDYSTAEISLINGAMGVGLTIATIPCTLSFSHFGMKWPLFLAGLVSAGSTALMPMASIYHLNAVLVLRVVQGLAYGANLPAIGKLCSSWAALKQAGFFVSVLTSYMALSSGLTNSLGGMICESRFGWPMVYYAHSGVCVILFAFFIILYNDRPDESNKVTPKELSKIHRNKSEAQIQGDRPIPYRQLFTDCVIWTIWINAAAEIFVTAFLTLHLPDYIRNVLKYSIEETGHYAALSRIAQVPFRILFGYLSDKIRIFDDDAKLIIFNSIALGGVGLSIIGVGFVPDEYPGLGILLLTVVSIVSGAVSAGFFKCAVLYARQYSEFVIGNCQLIKCACFFIGPAAFALFVTGTGADKSEWRKIFIISGIFAIAVNFLFCKMSTATPAAYTAEGYFASRDIRTTEMSERPKQPSPSSSTSTPSKTPTASTEEKKITFSL